jgi:predicted  nucleic acid-binding Zn-ribbon protein
MKNKLKTKADELETDINNLTESTIKLTEEIELASKPYEELVKHFNATVQDYEETKRHVISIKLL